MSDYDKYSGGMQDPLELAQEEAALPLIPEEDPLTLSTSMSVGPNILGGRPDEPTLPGKPTVPFVPSVSEGVDPAFNVGLTLDDVVKPLPEPEVPDNTRVREEPNTVIADANKTKYERTDVYNTPTPDQFIFDRINNLNLGARMRSGEYPSSESELAAIKKVMDAEDKRISEMTSETVGGMPLSKEEMADEVTRKYALENRVPAWSDLSVYDPFYTSFPRYKKYGQSSAWPVPWSEPRIKSAITDPTSEPRHPQPKEGFSTPGGHPGPMGLEGLEGPMGPQGYIPHPSSMGEREGALGFRSALRKRKNPVLINVFDDNAFA